MIARVSHTNGLFRTNSAAVYYKLEEKTRTIAYVASITLVQPKKDGRAAFLALVSQYAGDDKWEVELKKQDNLIHTHLWKGQSNFTLEKFVTMH